MSRPGSFGKRVAEGWKVRLPEWVRTLHWWPGEAEVIATTGDGEVCRIDGRSGAIVDRFEAHSMGILAAAVQPRGTLYATGGEDGYLRLWPNGRAEGRIQTPRQKGWVEHVTWHPRGTVVAAATGRRVTLWRPDGELVAEYTCQGGAVLALAWHPAADYLVLAFGGGIELLHPDTLELADRKETDSAVLSLLWSPTGDHLAAGCQDDTVRFWVYPQMTDSQMQGYPHHPRVLAWHPKGWRLATSGSPVPVVWNFTGEGPEGTTPDDFEGMAEDISAMAFDFMGQLLAAASVDGEFVLWDARNGAMLSNNIRLSEEVTGLLWRSDGRQVVLSSGDGDVVSLRMP